MSLSRRSFLAGTAAATAATTLRAPYVQAQKKGGTLRFVPHADLKIVDPIWTTAYITRNHGYMIFDTLFALDADLKLRPQMVDKWTVSRDAMKYSFTLRDGLKFHDGQPVTAEDCVASIKRWGARDAVGRLMMAAVGKMAPVDRKTFTIDLEQPFGLVLDALGKPSASPSFIMPARLAATDPNEQIKEVVGSGPFKFAKDEWQPGNRVVYLRNADYVPRTEAPSGAAGAKRPLVDRVEWRYIPDAATAGAALEAGEVDYWENVPLDFAPRLEKNPDLRVFVTDPRGSQGILRPNHLHPPFNNKAARQALLYAVDQQKYLQAVIGNAKYFRTCPSLFMCGGLPYETAVGAPKPDLARAKALLKESGYDGRPIVVLDPADSPYAHGPALVTAQLLRSLGANADLQAMDWSTMVSRRAKKEPPAQGGWNIFHTWSTSFDTMTPAVSSVLGGAGDKAWFGWPTSEPIEKLRAQFTREADPAKRKALADEVQKIAYDEVLYVPWGQFVIPGAFRKNVRGVLEFGATLLWNIQV
ncbi:MAG TPA: ABC transporter substrate-binding protein [Methylomirabilota bacterium]|nr:ABC transporter substrate-binding protein [Methylomirabilota bacterium]